MMIQNNDLKLHFVNVNHGDATIIEFPDYGNPLKAHFAVVDFGAKLKKDREATSKYMRSLVDFRRNNDPDFDYEIDFACVTHPHDDHYGGLTRFMKKFADPNNDDNNKIKQFWDCGFRTTSITYNRILYNIGDNNNLTFTRVSAGSEFEFGDTRITVLAPSVDLRNRFDTFGINKNNSSIVLKIKYKNSYIIIAGDAEYASWAKTTEEFPRQERIKFYKDSMGLAERKTTSDQLKCNLLRISHHGSKHGTSLEYLERMKPKHVVIPAGDQAWYRQYVPNWEGNFPHPLITKTLDVLNANLETHITGETGNLIFKYTGNWSPKKYVMFDDEPDSNNFDAALLSNWNQL